MTRDHRPVSKKKRTTPEGFHQIHFILMLSIFKNMKCDRGWQYKPLKDDCNHFVESRVVGFTTKYIPGGTLENPKVPFQIDWIKQLTQLVDYFNLELGIMHQDSAPRKSAH